LKNGDVITKPPVKHNRNLSIAELRQFCSSLEKFSAYRATGIAIELLMLTFVRTQELRAATWDEFDLEKAAWRIPAERMKRKDQGDHLVPLSKQAVALLKELQEITGISKSGPKWLFRNTRRDTECMSATTIYRALERMGFCGKGTIGFSAHGFRGTASTHLHEMKFLTQAIEAQLAHKERNASKASYNQAEYVPERTAMMQQWADYLDEMKAGNAADIADAPVAKS
jgi:integrase